MRKNKILALLLAVCLTVVMMPQMAFAAESNSAEKTDIAIVYTGDIHGGAQDNISLAGVAAYAKEMSADNKYVEIVDAGDSLAGAALANSSKGEFMMNALSTAGYGICVPSGADFNFGVDTLMKTIDNASSYEYTSCNFVNASTGKTVFGAYKIVIYGTTSVAYVGISDPLTASITTSSLGSTYKFLGANSASELYTAVQDAVDSAKADGADYVIAIANLSKTGSDALAAKSVIANTTGITAFITSGDHTAVSGEQVSNKSGQKVLLTSAGSALNNIGVLTLSPGKSISSQLVSGYSYRDITTKDAIDALATKYSAGLKETIGTATYKQVVADSSGVRLVGKSETNLGDLVADAYRAAADADIAFVEASEIQSEIAIGDVSYSTIQKVLPGDKNIDVVKVSGTDILDALEMAARLYPSNNEGFLQVSGLTYDIQETVKSSVKTDASGNFSNVSGEYRVTNVKIGGKDLDLMGTYTVAGSSELLSGSTGYTMFKEATAYKSAVTTSVQALGEYITKDLSGTIGSKYAKSQTRIDSIKLARQSEIDAQIETGINEKMADLNEEVEELREELAVQKQIAAIKSMSISASSKVIKNGSSRKIKVSWTTSGGTVSNLKYQVYKSTKKSSGYKKIFTTSNKSMTNSSSVSKGKTYYYKVRGYKYVGGKYYYTAWSNKTYKKVS